MEKMPQMEPEDASHEIGSEEQKKKRIPGVLADDYEPGGETEQRAVTVQSILESLRGERNPEEPIRVEEERGGVEEKLEQVEELIGHERQNDGPLSSTRESLGIPPQKSPLLIQLEEVKSKLEDEKKQVETAEEFNGILESMGEMSSDEIRHLAEHGKTLSGENLRDKYGREIEKGLSRELAGLYRSGHRGGITWGQLSKLMKIADAVLRDITGTVKNAAKKLFGIGGGKIE